MGSELGSGSDVIYMYIDLSNKIENDLSEIIEKNKTGRLTNSEFNKCWTDIVGIPLLRLEEFIQSSVYTSRGYNYEEATIHGLMVRIFKYLAWERRMVCNGLLTVDIATIFSRIIFEDNVKVQYFMRERERIYDYRLNSLKAEKDFEKAIELRRKERDEADTDEAFIEYEKGLLESIQNTYSKAGGLPGKKFIIRGRDRIICAR